MHLINPALNMLCQRCQRHIRSSGGLKCGICESKFHLRCGNGDDIDFRNCGDRAYNWKCALCQNSDINFSLENATDKEANFLKAINALSEKFELINKIQIPKLSNELQYLKSITDRIVKQNESILRKIDGHDVKNIKPNKNLQSPSQWLRKRNIHLPSNTKNNEKSDNEPIIPIAEKTVRFRPRRRSSSDCISSSSSSTHVRPLLDIGLP
ncbi:hypothetical protein evm_008502 [Chilo suppressalis]|nr:hypothetical protein evm_008502 [Chilo suppressalis]